MPLMAVKLTIVDRGAFARISSYPGAKGLEDALLFGVSRELPILP